MSSNNKFSGRGRIVSTTITDTNGHPITNMKLDVIYYYEGSLTGALTYPTKLEEVTIDQATNKGTYKIEGRFDGRRLQSAPYLKLSIVDEGEVDLNSLTWTGQWQGVERSSHSNHMLRRLRGTVSGSIEFTSPAEFLVRGDYTVKLKPN